MRGTVLAAFLVVFVGVAVAYPWAERRARLSNQNEGEDGIYPSGRTRPVSTRRSGSAVSSSPYYYFRSPRYIARDDEEFIPAGGRRYKVYRKDQEQQEESEEEEDDDVADDDDDQDEAEDEPEDDQEFDTPTWERLFPREEQGSRGQGGPQGPPPSEGGYGASQQQAAGPPPSGGGYGAPAPQRSDEYKLVGFGGPGGSQSPYDGDGPSGAPGPQRRQRLSFGSSGRPSGRSGFIPQEYNQVRPISLRVVKPRNYNGVTPSQKSWAVQNPEVEGRQYYGSRNVRPQQVQYAYSRPSVSRRWARQPHYYEQQPQYSYQSRPVYRRPYSGGYYWGRQRRSQE